MALEDGKLVSREDLKAKINELIKLVSDQSDVLTTSNVSTFLDKSLIKYKIWTWRSHGVVINVPHPLGDNPIPSLQVKDHYYTIPKNHILYNIDLSYAALLLRFKSNPSDPVFTALREFDNLHIEQNGNVYTFKSNGGPAMCYYTYNAGWRIMRRQNGSSNTVISGEATEYVNVSDTGRVNSDTLAGGASLQSLLSESVINEYFTSDNVNLSITDNDVPRPENIIEDNEMNITFRTLLTIFSKIRMVSFQKQYNDRYRGGYYNVGQPIDSQVYLKNLKKITPININDIFHNFNVDQRLIDNIDVINKLYEIYEIWKKLPKETIYLRYCHTNCHGSHHSRH